MQKNKILKKDLTKMISEKTCIPSNHVNIVYDALEDIVVGLINDVTTDNPIKIELFKGLHINGKFIPEKEICNNITGNKMKVGNNIKVNCTTTSTFKQNYLKK